MNGPDEKIKTILVVDDEPDIVSFLSALLKDNGYNVIIARDGQEGLDLARTEKPDLVSLDISMPKKSGVRLYRDLKADPELSKIPVMMVTGVLDRFQKFISTRNQVPPPDGYLTKPFKQAQYMEAIKALLSPEIVSDQALD